MTSNQSLQLTAGRRDDQISIDAGADYGEKRTQFPVDAGRESGLNGIVRRTLMAVAVMYEFRSMNQEIYDRFIRERCQGQSMPGVISHAAGPLEGGW